jgi:AcrR family transcriptional regulator
MSIERVARRAGVGKTAVYRRWGSKLEMVIEMVSAVAVDVTELPDTGSLRSDIETVLMIAAHALRHPLATHIVPDLLAEAARNPAIGAILYETLSDNQRGIGTLLVDRAKRRGELTGPVDPDFLVDLVVGPLYWRLAVARAPLSANYPPNWPPRSPPPSPPMPGTGRSGAGRCRRSRRRALQKPGRRDRVEPTRSALRTGLSEP